MLLAFVVLTLCCGLDQTSAQSALDQNVDRLMRETGSDTTRAQARAELTKLAARAVPRLIQHAQSGDLPTRLLALQCFQYCWSQEAQAVVVAAPMDTDARVRQVAHWALMAHARGNDLVKAMEPVAQHQNPSVSAPALAVLLRATPDANRMMRALAVPDVWPQLADQLPRYQHKEFTVRTRAMLRHPDPNVVRHAFSALIHQMDDHEVTRRYSQKLLGHQNPAWRELAAEYLLWHGTESEKTALEQLAKTDPDLYARAAAKTALEAIDLRTTRFPRTDDFSAPQWPSIPTDAYQHGLKLLNQEPSNACRDAVVMMLKNMEAIEPVYTYAGRTGKTEVHARQSARLILVQAISGLPSPQQEIPSANAVIPPTQKLTPPVRDYFNDRHYSYGELVDANRGGPFAGTYHVGEDVAIGYPRTTVVAIADGTVKLAMAGVRSWGGLVVIEHRNTDDKPWCSLYGHLGPLICVRTGERVVRGTKLGSLGRGACWENGGYAAHLHFGIYAASFDTDQGRWITGYLSPAEFKSDSHHWRDPRTYLRSKH
jgi:murein DD-endopeptidase MepM/ murein hydrolase activator NlpD